LLTNNFHLSAFILPPFKTAPRRIRNRLEIILPLCDGIFVMKKLIPAFAALGMIVSTVGTAFAAEDEVAILETNKGRIVVEFWPDVAPETVANFKKLARDGFYDGTLFHRIIPGFMAQGGDPFTKDATMESQWGTGDPGYKIKAEFNDRKHERGVLSMARSQDPNSAGSQFFLMFGRSPHLDGQYTGFGKMLEGEETLAAIEKTPVGMSATGEQSKPREKVVLESVKIVPRSEAQE
jgi:peptidyl-prolyl cis-trans isomerase B (cyclophilin B)